jgi:(p)ppGpp synthase/HD superfamily hydrolase
VPDPRLPDPAWRELDPVLRADHVADAAHLGQLRADGVTPYIRHPRRVAELVNKVMKDHLFMAFYGGAAGTDLTRDLAVGERAQVVALLHDVLEDTPVTAGHLQDLGFSQEVLIAVTCLTRVPGVSYVDYLVGILNHPDPVVRMVKLADLEANLEDVDNVPDETRRKAMRTKFELAHYILSSGADDGTA